MTAYNERHEQKDLRDRLYEVARGLTEAEDIYALDVAPEYVRGQVELICGMLHIDTDGKDAVEKEIWPDPHPLILVGLTEGQIGSLLDDIAHHDQTTEHWDAITRILNGALNASH